jgi:hypothetical protein
MGIDPVSLAIGTAVIGAAGAATSAYGAYEQGQATAASDAYQAQVAANNAAIATTESKQDIQSGEIAAVNKGLQTRAAIGTEKAQQGASGIDVNTGSAADVRAGTAEMGMVDALNIRSNASKKAWSDEVAATSDTAQGQLDTMGATQAQTAGDIGAAGTLLTGASTVGTNYVKFQNAFGNGATAT